MCAVGSVPGIGEDILQLQVSQFGRDYDGLCASTERVPDWPCRSGTES
jgi:hypothetical protein